MLRKLDAARLEELLRGAERLEWHLNAKVRDDEARKFLEDFETAVENFRKQRPAHLLAELKLVSTYGSSSIALRLRTTSPPAWSSSPSTASRYLGPTICSGNAHAEDGSSTRTASWSQMSYRSSNTVLLSVEPFGTQSRRARIFHTEIRLHLFAPDTRNRCLCKRRAAPLTGGAVR